MLCRELLAGKNVKLGLMEQTELSVLAEWPNDPARARTWRDSYLYSMLREEWRALDDKEH